MLGRRRARWQADLDADGRQAEPGETVVFSWITWPSRQVRDAGMKAFMEDPRCPKDMPFDGKRLIYGGFHVLLSA
jgi:uncharacterized protein YbaA (DUF1428 family)